MPIATFAAGCFWGIEANFRKIDGVLDTRVGYTGGHVSHPSYEQVCQGDTGHAEAVEVRFAADKVSYEQLLNAFWQMHDPTTVDRQGVDIGSQYRSVVFYHDEIQREQAEKSKLVLNKANPIVTQIVPAREFYPAEEYHQCYFEKQRHK